MHVFFYGRWAMFQGRMWESIPLPGVNVEIFVVVMLLAFHLWTPKKSCVCHATWHPKLACTPHSKKKQLHQMNVCATAPGNEPRKPVWRGGGGRSAPITTWRSGPRPAGSGWRPSWRRWASCLPLTTGRALPCCLSGRFLGMAFFCSYGALHRGGICFTFFWAFLGIFFSFFFSNFLMHFFFAVHQFFCIFLPFFAKMQKKCNLSFFEKFWIFCCWNFPHNLYLIYFYHNS